MTSTIAIILGVVLGFLGAAPLLFVMHRAVSAMMGKGTAPNVPIGFAAIVHSGFIIMMGIFATYIYAPTYLVLLSTIAVMLMLVITVAYGLFAWHRMSSL